MSLFVAINFDESTKKQLLSVQDKLKNISAFINNFLELINNAKENI